ncbi:MAG: hypothetical protein ACK58N_11250, partial [Synechocystis sp.]
GGSYLLVSEDRLIEINHSPKMSPLTPAVSSTYFRQTKDQKIIPDVVQRYIDQQKLYDQN